MGHESLDTIHTIGEALKDVDLLLDRAEQWLDEDRQAQEAARDIQLNAIAGALKAIKREHPEVHPSLLSCIEDNLDDGLDMIETPSDILYDTSRIMKRLREWLVDNKLAYDKQRLAEQ